MQKYGNRSGNSPVSHYDIGEDCIIESQVVAEPGIIIGRKCKIAPLKKLNNNIPSESKVM